MRDFSGQAVFDASEVVSFYTNANTLSCVEIELFEKFVPRGAAILDLGVGGGRTVPYLSGIAKYYVGIDYAPNMVEACRTKYPSLDIRLMNATDLSDFPDNSFDAVVFSFNGIDYIPSDAARRSCLSEIRRVLRTDGVFLFSVHNARRIVEAPFYRDASMLQRVWRTLRAFVLTLRLAPSGLLAPAFWRGSGYVRDRVHGGIDTHVASPMAVTSELNENGFCGVECRPGVEAHFHSWVSTPFYYYVAKPRAELTAK